MSISLNVSDGSDMLTCMAILLMEFWNPIIPLRPDDDMLLGLMPFICC